MTTTMREKDVQDAILESLASHDWSPEHLVREHAEARLGHKLKRYEFSRGILALFTAGRIERRRVRANGDGALPFMQYRRITS